MSHKEHAALMKRLGNGEHLPKWMRDFHDQKELFKAIEQSMGLEKTACVEGVGWVSAHCYTTDKFLVFMAAHGYVLAKTGEFGDYDIAETIDKCRNMRNRVDFNAMKAAQDNAGGEGVI